MGATTPVRRVAHVLVQQRDARGRTGSLHAAVAAPGGYRTACGSDLLATDRAPISEWTGLDAQWLLSTPDARICARCDRVGDALAAES